MCNLNMESGWQNTDFKHSINRKTGDVFGVQWAWVWKILWHNIRSDKQGRNIVYRLSANYGKEFKFSFQCEGKGSIDKGKLFKVLKQ